MGRKIKKNKKPLINELIFECYLDAMIKTLKKGNDASKIFNRLNEMVMNKK